MIRSTVASQLTGPGSQTGAKEQEEAEEKWHGGLACFSFCSILQHIIVEPPAKFLSITLETVGPARARINNLLGLQKFELSGKVVCFIGAY